MARYRGRQGCSSVSVTLLETMDLVIEFDYEVICDAIPQSYDEPYSSMECEISFTGIYEDIPGAKNRPRNYLETPVWLEKVLAEYLEESHSVYDAIRRDLED